MNCTALVCSIGIKGNKGLLDHLVLYKPMGHVVQLYWGISELCFEKSDGLMAQFGCEGLNALFIIYLFPDCRRVKGV